MVIITELPLNSHQIIIMAANDKKYVLLFRSANTRWNYDAMGNVNSVVTSIRKVIVSNEVDYAFIYVRVHTSRMQYIQKM